MFNLATFCSLGGGCATLWIKPSYETDPNDSTIFNDIPSIFILTSDKRWWDLHKEVLL